MLNKSTPKWTIGAAALLALTVGIEFRKGGIEGASAAMRGATPIQGASTAPFPYGVVAGRVLATDGTPVPDVRVAAVLPPSTITNLNLIRGVGENTDITVVSATKSDAAGRYRLENLPPRNHYIVAGATFFPSANTMGAATPVLAQAGAVTDVDIRQIAGFKVSGRLAIAPLLPHTPSITARIWPQRAQGIRNRPPTWETESGPRLMMETALRPDLTFEFLNVPPGIYDVTTSIALPAMSVTVVDRNVNGVEIGAGVPGERLTGTVVSPTGSLAGFPPLLAVIDSARTPVNPDGTFEFLRLPSANSRGTQMLGVIDASNRQFLGQESVAVSGQAIRGFQIPVSFATLVTGRVLLEGAVAGPATPVQGQPASPIPIATTYTSTGDQFESPIPSAPMFVVSSKSTAPNPIFQATATTPVGGFFSFSAMDGQLELSLRNVPEGYVVKSITSASKNLLQEPLLVAGRPVDPIQITIAHTGWRFASISGRILNQDGSPASAIMVGAVEAPGAGRPLQPTFPLRELPAFGRTGSDGQYRLENLPPGRYFLVAGTVFQPSGQARVAPAGIDTQMTFFPGAPDRAGATAVTLDSGAALQASFRLAFPPTAPPQRRGGG